MPPVRSQIPPGAMAQMLCPVTARTARITSSYEGPTDRPLEERPRSRSGNPEQALSRDDSQPDGALRKHVTPASLRPAAGPVP